MNWERFINDTEWLYKYIAIKWYRVTEEEAKDIVYGVYERLLRYDNVSYDNLRGLGLTATKNACMNYLRNRSRALSRVEVGSVNNHEHLANTIIYSVEDESIIYSLDTEVLNKAIRSKYAKLTDREKETFNYRRMGYKYDEIAHYMGISIGAVKSNLFHCRKKFEDIRSYIIS